VTLQEGIGDRVFEREIIRGAVLAVHEFPLFMRKRPWRISQNDNRILLLVTVFVSLLSFFGVFWLSIRAWQRLPARSGFCRDGADGLTAAGSLAAGLQIRASSIERTIHVDASQCKFALFEPYLF